MNLSYEDQWWAIFSHRHTDTPSQDVAKQLGITDVELKQVIDNSTSREDCECPNIQYQEDEYDEKGIRTVKHNWTCPDCGFLQVG